MLLQRLSKNIAVKEKKGIPPKSTEMDEVFCSVKMEPDSPGCDECSSRDPLRILVYGPHTMGLRAEGVGVHKGFKKFVCY